ncbi:MAG: A/G-specific adenine glycosylase [Gammaproteobacteria bacterium]
MTPESFQSLLLDWFRLHGRKELPWRRDISPYRIWISEIMLQQTQVKTVIPYFTRFIGRFPEVDVLAETPLDTVLFYWSGLGYYARARNLHNAACIITRQGSFPISLDALTQLPGIGLSTAGAIMSIAYEISHPILDGNVKRVLSRFMGIEGWPGDAKINRELWSVSRNFTPTKRVADYTQAIMDLGATLCTPSNPFCADCPVKQGCIAYRENRTDRLPSPKPRKKIPVKTNYMLILLNPDRHVLLEKRPSTGIWGGMWSLPEFLEIDSALTWCYRHDFDVSEHCLLPEQRHTFSHFHLDFTPIIVQTNNPRNVVMEPDRAVWYNIRQKNKLGLPAPVKRLLERLASDF